MNKNYITPELTEIRLTEAEGCLCASVNYLSAEQNEDIIENEYIW